MKKLNTKLSLNKRTLASLDENQMANVKGGFTYSLSLGDVCRLSNAFELSRETCQGMWRDCQVCTLGA